MGVLANETVGWSLSLVGVTRHATLHLRLGRSKDDLWPSRPVEGGGKFFDLLAWTGTHRARRGSEKEGVVSSPGWGPNFRVDHGWKLQAAGETRGRSTSRTSRGRFLYLSFLLLCLLLY